MEPPPDRTPPPSVPPPGAEGSAPSRDQDAYAPIGATPAVPPPPAPGSEPAPTAGPPVRPGLDDRERTLDSQIVAVWRVMAALSWLIPLGGLTVIGFVVLRGYGWIVAAVCLGLYGLFVGWLPPARYARWRWQLTPLALELRYGVVVRQYEAVPYFRIQQIDITRGPIDRLLGLATLVVTTASASGSATLPGIAATDAPEVRAELLARAADAVAEHPGDLQDAV